MQVSVQFYSYFKELTGCAKTMETLPEHCSLARCYVQLLVRFPRLEPMRKSTLLAVGLEYRDPDYILHDGDEICLFPPVQGG